MSASEGMASAANAITITPLLTPEDAAAFRALNEEWITRYFVLEPKDHATLSDPQSMILSKGGHIFMVHQRDKIVGCVALIPEGDGLFELSKMAVAPAVRGLGIGRTLLEYAIAQARLLGARTLWLGSNSRLRNAVHLYESVGFRHVPPERLPVSNYARADVFMELVL